MELSLELLAQIEAAGNHHVDTPEYTGLYFGSEGRSGDVLFQNGRENLVTRKPISIPLLQAGDQFSITTVDSRDKLHDIGFTVTSPVRPSVRTPGVWENATVTIDVIGLDDEERSIPMKLIGCTDGKTMDYSSIKANDGQMVLEGEGGIINLPIRSYTSTRKDRISSLLPETITGYERTIAHIELEKLFKSMIASGYDEDGQYEGEGSYKRHRLESFISIPQNNGSLDTLVLFDKKNKIATRIVASKSIKDDSDIYYISRYYGVISDDDDSFMHAIPYHHEYSTHEVFSGDPAIDSAIGISIPGKDGERSFFDISLYPDGEVVSNLSAQELQKIGCSIETEVNSISILAETFWRIKKIQTPGNNRYMPEVFAGIKLVKDNGGYTLKNVSLD